MKPRLNADRDTQIFERASDGERLDSLAEEFNLTRQRISQIVKSGERGGSMSERERAKDRHWHIQKIAELQSVIDNPPPVHSATGKTVVDVRTGELIVNSMVVIAAIREARLHKESVRAMDAVGKKDEKPLAFDDAAREIMAHIEKIERRQAVAGHVVREIES